MEEELIDQETHYPKGSGKQTIRLFLISVCLFALMGITSLFDIFFRIHEPITFIPLVCGVGAYGVSIAGMVKGFSETNYSTYWVKTGLIGNLIIVAAPALLMIGNLIFAIFKMYF